MTGFEERMQALRQRFVAQALADADAIEESAAGMEWRRVRDLSHGLSGRAGMFGFHALSETAGHLEEAIDEERAPDALSPLVDALVSGLRGLERDV